MSNLEKVRTNIGHRASSRCPSDERLLRLGSKKRSAKKKTDDVEIGLNSSNTASPMSKDETKSPTKTNEEMVSSILADIIKDSIKTKESSDPSPDPSRTFVPFCNQTMTVNALHLAILSKQSGAVKCIMNHTLFNENKDKENAVSTLIELLSNEVEIDYHTDKFTKHEQALDGMNALHLCCQYHPDALHVIFEAITDYEKKCSNDQRFIQKRNTTYRIHSLEI